MHGLFAGTLRTQTADSSAAAGKTIRADREGPLLGHPPNAIQKSAATADTPSRCRNVSVADLAQLYPHPDGRTQYMDQWAGVYSHFGAKRHDRSGAIECVAGVHYLHGDFEFSDFIAGDLERLLFLVPILL